MAISKVNFPAKRDHEADSTSQALDWLKNFMSEPGILVHYRRKGARPIPQRSNVDIPKSMIPYCRSGGG